MMDQRAADDLASRVRAARLAFGWGYEEAARRAAISSITWRRVEDGLRVQEPKLAAMEKALGWAPDTARTILASAAAVGPGTQDDDANYVASTVAGDQARAGVTDDDLIGEIRQLKATFDKQLDELERRIRDRSVGGSA